MKAFHNFWAIYPIDQKSEEYLCLSAICKDGKDEVTIERFNKILNWFGPMENGRDFLRNVIFFFFFFNILKIFLKDR